MGGQTQHPSSRFFGATETYLAQQQITHAGDTLNAYCQLAVAEILTTAPKTWNIVSKKLSRFKNPADAIAAMRMFRASDIAVRELLRDDIATFWSPESDIISVLRNKIVHQRGIDPNREVDAAIARQNGRWCIVHPVDLAEGVIPITYSGDQLVVDAMTGYWACRHVQNHIHLMDQNLVARFSLPAERYRPKSFKYTRSAANSTQLPLPPGTPLPRSVSVHSNAPIKFSSNVNFKNYDMVENPKEIQCAKTRRQIFEQICEFVIGYCEETKLRTVKVSNGMPGSVLPHTIRGHDLHLGFSIEPIENSENTSEFVGVRIREADFDTLITIWGTKSLMRDFKSEIFDDSVREYVKDCIDKAWKS